MSPSATQHIERFESRPLPHESEPHSVESVMRRARAAQATFADVDPGRAPAAGGGRGGGGLQPPKA